ncbi:hypothetical protein SKAU_G00159970 [Synaphobranchus kaupii]|uniref:Uncharacterized protein n=1 Tax=Synaphobranchus kaupii TaxID=118154 RepID=A0A9Q1FIS5_SYNKA|nr:hypothetical protein SKAU_G00159970 [Synaphobranchus kaupii]
MIYVCSNHAGCAVHPAALLAVPSVTLKRLAGVELVTLQCRPRSGVQALQSSSWAERRVLASADTVLEAGSAPQQTPVREPLSLP